MTSNSIFSFRKDVHNLQITPLNTLALERSLYKSNHTRESKNHSRATMLVSKANFLSEAATLKKSLLGKIETLNSLLTSQNTSLLRSILNISLYCLTFWKAPIYNSLLKKLAEIEAKIDAVEIPAHINFKFSFSHHATALLDANGLADFPQKETLATFIVREKFELMENGTVTTREEIQKLNGIIKKYFTSLPGYLSANVAFFLDERFESPTCLTTEALNEIITQINQFTELNEEEIETLLKHLGFDQYIDPETFQAFYTHLKETRLFLEDGKPDLTPNDKKILIQLTQNFYRGSYPPIITEADLADGKSFAICLTRNKMASSYKKTPLETKERARALVQNTLQLPKDHPLNEAIIQEILHEKPTLKQYAHLSTKEEAITFSKIVLSALSQFSTPSDLPIIRAELQEFFSFLTGSPATSTAHKLEAEQVAISTHMQHIQANYEAKLSNPQFDGLIQRDELLALYDSLTPPTSPTCRTPSTPLLDPELASDLTDLRQTASSLIAGLSSLWK
jgi:hypothetical protein